MNRQEAAVIARAKKAELAGPVERRFWSKVRILGPDECWPWLAAPRNKGKGQGYGAFWMNGRHHPSNRIAWELSNGMAMPEGMFACHRCDSPPCCNPAHIFPGTHQDNNDDKVFKGRHVRGERMWTAKLTAEQVAEIRASKPADQKAPRGHSQKLAEKYGVTSQYISEIFAYKSWRD